MKNNIRLITFALLFFSGDSRVYCGDLLRVQRNDGFEGKPPIQFTKGLGLQLREPEARIEQSSDNRAAFTIHLPSIGKSVPITNSQIKSSAPISVVVPVTYNSVTGVAEVHTEKASPDSIKAWNDLKPWLSENLKDEKLITEIDAAAKKIAISYQKAVLDGKADSKKELLADYDELQAALVAAASDKKANYDARKQVGFAVEGARQERLILDKEPDLTVLKPHAINEPNTNRAAMVVPKSGSLLANATTYHGISGQGFQQPFYHRAINQTGRASVSLWEVVQTPDSVVRERSFASGTIIGPDLILTCAHTVARPTPDGAAAINPAHLQVQIGHEVPGDRFTPATKSPATIYHVGCVGKNGAALDFAVLKCPALRNWHSREDIKVLQLPPIRPVPLADFEAGETAISDPSSYFFMVGHPVGCPKLVSLNGAVLFPHYISETSRDSRYSALTTIAGGEQTESAMRTTFNKRYQEESGGSAYRFTLSDKSDGIGVAFSNYTGFSGASAVQTFKGNLEYFIIGVLSEGSNPNANGEARSPSILAHEGLVPSVLIIEELDKKKPGWDKGVKVMQLTDDGQLIERPAKVTEDSSTN